jgi:hypothetical protein
MKGFVFTADYRGSETVPVEAEFKLYYLDIVTGGKRDKKYISHDTGFVTDARRAVDCWRGVW